MTPETIAAEVAARYGVTVSPAVVKLCPPCTFAEPYPVWDGAINRLVYPAADHKAKIKRAMWQGAQRARASAVTPELLDRRANVARMHGEGLCTRQIADALGIVYGMALRDQTVQNLAPHPAPYMSVMMDRAMMLAIECKALFDQGKTALQIGAILKIKDDRARSLLLTKFGIRFPKRVRQPKKKVSTRAPISKKQARHNTLRGFIADGTSPSTWAETCGVTAEVIRLDLREMGMPLAVIRSVKLPPRGERTLEMHRQRIAERQAKVREMTAQGMGPREIAKAVGVTRKVIGNDKKALGLTGVAA